MTISDDYKDYLKTDVLDHVIDNSRIATRYIREDIAVSITSKNLLGISKRVEATLLDITSKGVLVAATEKMAINKNIVLHLQFTTGKVFDIKAKIVRNAAADKNEYGIKYDLYNNELGDYLLETQSKLIFK
jgi:PilZ domain